MVKANAQRKHPRPCSRGSPSLDDDGVFEACVRERFACALLGELLDVERVGLTAKHDAVAAGRDFDLEVLDPAVRAVGDALCNKLK